MFDLDDVSEEQGFLVLGVENHSWAIDDFNFLVDDDLLESFREPWSGGYATRLRALQRVDDTRLTDVGVPDHTNRH